MLSFDANQRIARLVRINPEAAEVPAEIADRSRRRWSCPRVNRAQLQDVPKLIRKPVVPTSVPSALHLLVDLTHSLREKTASIRRLNSSSSAPAANAASR